MRQVYLLDLRSEDVASDYEGWHRPGRVPQAVLADIRAAGVEAMEIYRCSDRLVLISETSRDAPAADRLASQSSRNWEAMMDQFQKPLPQAACDQKWIEATKMFDLEDHQTQGNIQ